MAAGNLFQVLGYHRRMIGNPRYGVVGMLALPYYLIFEAVGPIIEIVGYVLTIGAAPFGFTRLAVRGTVLPGGDRLRVAALGRGGCPGGVLVPATTAACTDLLLLLGLGVIGDFGYRQLTTWWRIMGTYDFLRGKGGWGAMTRTGFSAK